MPGDSRGYHQKSAALLGQLNIEESKNILQFGLKHLPKSRKLKQAVENLDNNLMLIEQYEKEHGI